MSFLVVCMASLLLHWALDVMSVSVCHMLMTNRGVCSLRLSTDLYFQEIIFFFPKKELYDNFDIAEPSVAFMVLSQIVW